MNKRKLRLLLIVALLAIIVCSAIVYLKHDGKLENVVLEENVLPEESDILTMKAFWDTRDGCYEFTVEREYFSKILSELQPAKRDKNPAKWVVLGNLHLTCKNGKTLEVNLYILRRDHPGAFSVETPQGRIYYRGGDSLALNKALQDACGGSKDKHKFVESNDDF